MKKEKLILAAILFPITLVASIFVSGGLSLILAKEWEGIHQLADVGSLMERLVSDKQAGMLYLCVEGLLCTLILMMLFMTKGHESYESPMRDITDKIKTPVPAGQHQHGSSMWLPRNQYRKVFGSFTLDPQNPVFAELAAKGTEDIQSSKSKEDG